MIQSPLDIPNCLVWLDASDTTTLSSFSALNVSLDNKSHFNLLQGDFIGFWGDKSGNNYNFLNSFGLTGNRPTYSTTLCAVQFNGSSSYLTSTFTTTYSQQTVFIVTRPTGYATGRRLFSQSPLNTLDTTGFIPCIQMGSTNFTLPMIFGNSVSFQTDYCVMASWRANSNRSPIFQKFGDRVNFYNLWDIIISSHNGSRLVNFETTRTRMISAFPFTDSLTPSLTTNNTRLGAGIAANNLPVTDSFYQGVVREVIVYNRGLSDNEIFTVAGYLSGKWNLYQHPNNINIAIKPGFWSQSGIWSSGVTPQENDTVYENNIQMDLNVNFKVNLISKEFTFGQNRANFFTSGSRSLTANIIAGGGFTIHRGTIDHLGQGSTTLTIFGNLTGSQVGIGTHAIRTSLLFDGQQAFSNVIINGNCHGGLQPFSGAYWSSAVWFQSLGTLTINGDVYGGEAYSPGVYFDALGRCVVNGNVYGIGNVGQGAVDNNNIGFVTINGNVYGGRSTNTYGVVNRSVGDVVVNGSAVGGIGSNSVGAINLSRGGLLVKRAVGNQWGRGSVGISSAVGIRNTSIYGICFVKELEVGLRGLWPTLGHVNIAIDKNNSSTSTYALSSLLNGFTQTQMATISTFQNFSSLLSAATGLRMLYSAITGDVSLIPSVSHVRLNTLYEFGGRKGTLHIPNPVVVLSGVPVDNTFGIGVYDSSLVWTVCAENIRIPGTMGNLVYNLIDIPKAGEIITLLK